jgi:predicted esterase
MLRFHSYLLLINLVLVSCSVNEDPADITKSVTDSQVNSGRFIDSLFYIDSIKVRIIKRTNSNKDLLLLPGWNFPISHWGDSTRILEYARKYNYNVIMPEMKKSIYHKELYAATHADYRQEKSLHWLSDSFIPRLNSLELLLMENEVTVLGISTGGRGAVALKFALNDIFDDAVSLSGDFSTVSFPDDNLYKRYFGEMKSNPAIWKREDLTQIPLQLSGNIILYHGKMDDIVPFKHSVLLNESLQAKEKNCKLKLDNSAGHNYTYWNQAIEDYFTTRNE